MKSTLLLCVVVVAVHTVLAQDVQQAAIVYKRVSTYEEQYNNQNNARSVNRVSIWQPTNPQYEYYAVGDVVMPGGSKPESSAVMVKEITPGSLAQPTDFKEVWNNKGSGEIFVSIVEMIPPSGFTCVGHLAVKYKAPELAKYRCVKSSYILPGEYESEWIDRNSGASGNVRIWGNYVSSANTWAVDASTFTAFNTYSTPSGSPDMMDGRHVVGHQTVEADTPPDFAMTVYETESVKQMWSSVKYSGPSTSTVYKDVTIWRGLGPSDTFSLGDIPVSGTTPLTKAYVVKSAKGKNALDAPFGYDQIWTDANSNAVKNAKIFQVKCNPGYQALGEVVVDDTRLTEPPAGSIRCVKSEYTTKGKFDWVWNSGGTNADYITFYKGIADPVESGPGQGVDALNTVNRLGSISGTAYVLKPDQVNFVIGGAAQKYVLSDVVYNFDDEKSVTMEPASLARSVIRNKGDSEQTVTRDLEYTYDETYSWGNSAGVEIGVETEVKAGIPLFGSVEFTASASTSYSHDWGSSTSSTKSDKISVAITVAAKSSKTAIIVGTRSTRDIPYTATLVAQYANGQNSKTTKNYSGIFRGVQVNDITVTYEPDVPMELE